MCPLHRLLLLDEVKRRLDAGEPCYLVSTQLIEAGVDIDFPFVLRELAPLEAIVQSAGRCNREMRLATKNGRPGGKLLVFRSVEGRLPPDPWYSAGRSVVEQNFLNKGREPRIEEPGDMREYFERLYRTGQLDRWQIQQLRHKGNFAEIASRYRLIDDGGIAVVVATWQGREDEVAKLLGDVRRRPTRAAFRKLIPFQVNLRMLELRKLEGAYSKESANVYVWRGGYDTDFGLSAEAADVLLLV